MLEGHISQAIGIDTWRCHSWHGRVAQGFNKVEVVRWRLISKSVMSMSHWKTLYRKPWYRQTFNCKTVNRKQRYIEEQYIERRYVETFKGFRPLAAGPPMSIAGWPSVMTGIVSWLTITRRLCIETLHKFKIHISPFRLGGEPLKEGYNTLDIDCWQRTCEQW